MSTSATLVYTIELVPPLSLAQLLTAVEAVELDETDMAQLGATLTSDSSAIVGQTVERTIVFNISSAAFNENFPSADNQQASPFVNLYTTALGGALGMVVVASPPAIA